MNSRFLIGLVVVAVGAVLGWYIFANRSKLPSLSNLGGTPSPLVTPTPTVSLSNLGAASEGGSKGGVAERTVVTYTDAGFSPKTVTVKLGTTVAFMNDSASGLWVASNPHPQHTDLSGFDAGRSVSKGGSYEYTFTKTGSWNYHNHAKSTDTATVVVTE